MKAPATTAAAQAATSTPPALAFSPDPRDLTLPPLLGHQAAQQKAIAILALASRMPLPSSLPHGPPVPTAAPVLSSSAAAQLPLNPWVGGGARQSGTVQGTAGVASVDCTQVVPLHRWVPHPVSVHVLWKHLEAGVLGALCSEAGMDDKRWLRVACRMLAVS